jgi:hypothetical protein
MTFSVYYSLTTDADDDFVLLQSWNEDDFNDGEPTVLTLNLVGSEIARKRHYRLKITVSSGDDVKLCGIERRYRVQGRSR